MFTCNEKKLERMKISVNFEIVSSEGGDVASVVGERVWVTTKIDHETRQLRMLAILAAQIADCITQAASEWARENRIKLPTGIFHQLKLVFKMKSFRWRELGWRCWVGELSDDDKRPWEIFHVKNHSLIYTLCDSFSLGVKLAPLIRRYLSPQSSIDAELKSNFHINREYT